MADHVNYEAGTDVTDYQIAFGALPNHHCVLNKLDYVYPHPPYDDSMVDRFSDPGAGAFTYVSAKIVIEIRGECCCMVTLFLTLSSFFLPQKSRGRQFTVKDSVNGALILKLECV